MILFLLMFTFSAPSTIFANDPITVYINNGINSQQVAFPDQDPVIVDGRTLVPLRGVFEGLGFDVDWNSNELSATLIHNDLGDEIVISIGSSTFSANGTMHNLDVPAQIINGRTMLPIRAVLESVGCFVEWTEVTNSLSITPSLNSTMFTVNTGIIGSWLVSEPHFSRWFEGGEIVRFNEDGTGYELTGNTESHFTWSVNFPEPVAPEAIIPNRDERISLELKMIHEDSELTYFIIMGESHLFLFYHAGPPFSLARIGS